jgi:hypothetical protein
VKMIRVLIVNEASFMGPFTRSDDYRSHIGAEGARLNGLCPDSGITCYG